MTQRTKPHTPAEPKRRPARPAWQTEDEAGAGERSRSDVTRAVDLPSGALDPLRPPLRPRIAAVGVSRLQHLFRELIPEFADRAEIEIFPHGYDAAVNAIAASGNGFDVVVGAGSNGSYLRRRVPHPLVLVNVTGIDLFDALARARTLDPAIGLITYGATVPELAKFQTAFGIDFPHRSYRSRDEAQFQVKELALAGAKVIVGPGWVTDMATRAGLTGVFLYSLASVRRAVEAALEIASATQAESRRRSRMMLQRVDQSLRGGATLRASRPGPAALSALDDLIGRSPAMVRLRELARRYARVDATAVIVGESGTGKELVAQGLHRDGRRREGPFIAVNCAALPETLLESELFGHDEGAFTGARRGGRPGLIEAAQGGTLFLDEIGDMPASVQVRLLRVLQQREVVRVGATRPIPVDIRVIAATHRRLDDDVAAGTFRADLFYRLNVLRLDLPPLRRRVSDILTLFFLYFRAALADDHRRLTPATPRASRNPRDAVHAGADARGAPVSDGQGKTETTSPAAPRVYFSRAALRALRTHPWPGNVRELQNAAQRLAIHALLAPMPAIDVAALLEWLPELHRENDLHADDGARESGILKSRSRADERALIAAALDAHRGDRDAVCRELGISRTTLWRRLRSAA